MGQGFTVTPFVLETGSQDVAGLQQACQAIARDVAQALTAMAAAAGHPGLSAALTGAAGQGSRAYAAMCAALGHTGQSLASTAQNYLTADQRAASQASAVARSLFLSGLKA